MLDEDLKQLVSKAAAGDRNAEEELIKAFYNDIFKFLFFLCHSVELSQDLCQETFMKLLKNLHNIKDPRALRSWLFKTSKNLFLDFKRKYQADSLDLLQEKGLELFSTERDKELFIDASIRFKTLSVVERLALILIDYEGYTYEEAASFIGISQGSLKAKIKKARQHFLSKN